MTIRSVRWRLARLIAPGPVLAAPPDPGPAILVREADSDDTRFVVWVRPKTLDIEMTTTLPAFPDDETDWTYTPHRTAGTITGTI